jgi:hypothetical protein
MIAIAFKALVAVTAALLGAWMLRSKDLEAVSEANFLRRVVALQLVPTLALFVALYVVGHEQVTSDVPSYYLPAARAVLAGQVPFRDFSSSYAPLFGYVGAGLVSLWNSGKVFALFDCLLNALSLVLWHSCASALVARREARQSSVLFAASGHMMIQALLGTNQIWIAAALAGSAALAARDRESAAGAVQAVSLATTKFLVLLLWPALWICAPRRMRWLGSALLVSAAVYGVFAGAGADLLEPLRREGELISSGNLPYVLELAFGMGSRRGNLVFDAAALAALGAATAWLYVCSRRLARIERPRLLFASLAVLGLVFMLVSKKSFTGYAVFFMYPLNLLLVRGLSGERQRLAYLLIFNVLLAVEPSLWFHLGGEDRSLRQWLHETHDTAAVYSFILLDIALLACYGFAVLLAVREVRRTTRAATEVSSVTSTSAQSRPMEPTGPGPQGMNQTLARP